MAVSRIEVACARVRSRRAKGGHPRPWWVLGKELLVVVDLSSPAAAVKRGKHVTIRRKKTKGVLENNGLGSENGEAERRISACYPHEEFQIVVQGRRRNE